MCSTPPLAGQWQWLVTWEGGSSVAGPGTPPPVILQLLLLLIPRDVARRSQDTRTQQWPAVTSLSTPGSRMSFLRGSANYVWCTTSVLGKGATGAVFQVSWKLFLIFTLMRRPNTFYSSTQGKLMETDIGQRHDDIHFNLVPFFTLCDSNSAFAIMHILKSVSLVDMWWVAGSQQT